MVVLSSDPSIKPLSVLVAYLTVIHLIVDSLRDTLSATSDAAYPASRNAQTSERTATAKRTRLHAGTRIAIASPWTGQRRQFYYIDAPATPNRVDLIGTQDNQTKGPLPGAFSFRLRPSQPLPVLRVQFCERAWP